MRVGIYQNHPVFGEVEKNIEQAIEGLNDVTADLMVLPELFCTGYQFVSKEETESLA
ncbi:MAG: acyltransferase, partial [Deltaproteobacteria bacterium]|nr:acyltransferase [Deltaproteobacteria bacterium]